MTADIGLRVNTILQQLAAGDQTAVGRCLDEYGGLVWELARRYLGTDRSEIEDGVQEVFVSVWLSASRFDPALGSEPSFVATIAHRRLTDYRRRRAARRPKPDAVPGTILEAPPRPTSEDLSRLGEDFAALPEDERTALWMAVNRGMSHSEIAGATSSPIGTVKTRLRRAVMRLQEAWGVGRPAAAEARARP